MNHHICPKCNGKMKEGLVASIAHNGIQRIRLIWLDGPIRDGLLGGPTVKTSANGVERSVIDYACNNCGYIESYVAD